MGVDTTIAVLDADINMEETTNLAHDYDAFLECVSELDEELRLPFGYWESVASSIQEVHSFIEELEDPPAVNEPDLDSLLHSFYGYPFMRPHEFHWYTIIRNSVVMSGLIPEFLEEYSSRAAGLWHKFVGHRRQLEQYPIVEPPHDFRIGGSSYLVSLDGHVGFIQGEELATLATELRPILDETNRWYRSLDDKYQRHAERADPIKLVYSLANFYSNSGSDTVLFSMFN